MTRPIDQPKTTDPFDEVKFLCLGGGNEVGRSCHIVQYKGKTVMLDAGQHPAHSGLAALPFYDHFDLSTVDVLLISHFHVDHAASLPYVLAKTNFKGRIFMTHPTKAIYKWLIQDSVRVGNTSSNPTFQPVYNEQDHLTTFPKIEAIDYHTTHTVSSIRITPYPAGHVLGAAMFLIQIAGLNIFFTGDYSRESDRHLLSAEVPKGLRIDILITESTYGVASHVPRQEREASLLKSVTSIINRGGRVLMPVFALGRAQELLLILDEYWSKHPQYQNVPIYYASNLARKCMLVYQTYVGAMNENIKQQFRDRMHAAEAAGSGSIGGGPWDFRFVRSLKSLDKFEDIGSCVMLASPGMLQNGVSRDLLERWAPNEKNGVIITGYSVEGTMAKHLLLEPDEIQAIATRSTGAGRRNGNSESEQTLVPRRCSVHELSFAAHVDGIENREFIEEVNAQHVILVHGEQHNMMRLKSKLLSLNTTKAGKFKIYSPRNCEELRIPFQGDKSARVVGKLAETSLTMRSSLTHPEVHNTYTMVKDRDYTPTMLGVLVQNDFKISLMAPTDIREYAGLMTTTIKCRQRLSLPGVCPSLIRLTLESVFGRVENLGHTQTSQETSNGKVTQPGTLNCLVLGVVEVSLKADAFELRWDGNVFNDAVADAVMAVLLGLESSPASVKRSALGQSHMHTNNPTSSSFYGEGNQLQHLVLFLKAQFGADAVHVTATASETTPQNTSDVLETLDGSKDHSGQGAAIEIKIDKSYATVCLDTMGVQSNSKILGDRVKAVLERAVAVTAPTRNALRG